MTSGTFEASTGASGASDVTSFSLPLKLFLLSTDLRLFDERRDERRDLTLFFDRVDDVTLFNDFRELLEALREETCSRSDDVIDATFAEVASFDASVISGVLKFKRSRQRSLKVTKASRDRSPDADRGFRAI